MISLIGLMLLVTHRVVAATATQPATTTSTVSSQPRPALTPARDPLKDLPSYGQLLRRTAWTLLAIIAGLILAAKLLPRWLLNKANLVPRGGGKMIEVVESHRLEPRKAIYLIRVAGQYFLVASTGDRLETLAGGPLDQQKIADALRPGAKPRDEPAAPDRSFLEVLRGKPSP
jgi:flagellar biogenesis protein FliO